MSLRKIYPTGNAVDVAVDLQKLGISASVISTTGNDEYGKLMLNFLKEQALDISRLKIGNGKTAITYMDIKGTERIHGDYEEGVLERMVFDHDDIAFAGEHDLVHTALWGKADAVLKDIKSLGPLISFDYADRLEHPLVESTLPFVDYGFYSYKARDAYIEDFLRDKTRCGMKVAVATFGENGSLAADGDMFYDFGIFPAKVVNTVGAGDSFIAGFLYGVLHGWPVPACLENGARVAAKVVEVFEPWII